MKQHIFTLTALLLVPLASPFAANPEDSVVLRRVADGVLKQTTRRLINHGTGQTFEDSTGLAPKPEISIESKFNAWFYQTWLLADGMRRTAQALDEPRYRDYGEQNLEFIFRHTDYFKKQQDQHMNFAWVGGMSDWWHPEVKERFYEVVKPYRIACLINGHSHGASFAPWHDLLTVHDGSTARGEGGTGDFLVVRVTERELILAQRKLDGTWGIQMRRPLQNAPTISK